MMSFSSAAKKGGSIQLIMGPMFSGKSTELMRRMRRFRIAERNCVIVKYGNDTRYSDSCAATHDKVTMPAISVLKLSDISSKQFEGIDVIGIDEGQFFPDVVDFCENMANRGMTCIVSALDGTFERKPFPHIVNLIPLCEKILKLHAVCMLCREDASFSKRLGDEKEVEVIGGIEKYIAVCRTCYFTDASTHPRSPIKRKLATSSSSSSGTGTDSSNKENICPEGESSVKAFGSKKSKFLL